MKIEKPEPGCYLLLVVVLNLGAYFSILFLVNLKLQLNPYPDIDSYPYTHLVDRDALDSRTLLSPIGFICGVLASWISWLKVREKRSPKLIRLIFIVLTTTSVIAICFCGYRFIELINISSSLEHCDNFSGKSFGCYIQ